MKPTHLQRSFSALFSVLAAITWGIQAFAGPSWEDAASGKHSMQKLGGHFSLQVPVKNVEGARLVLFNYAAAQQLGLEIPQDPKELDKLMTDLFAVQVSPDGERKMMVTYYQDSGGKGPGEARGDGRAVWSGELVLPAPGGKKTYVDVVLKGTGQTPLAWLNHSDPGHKDGYQSMSEAVHAFEMSEANRQNELDTTLDLAVIEIPVSKVGKHTGVAEKAAITVRVGKQTRIAHLRYHADNVKDFKAIFEYCVARDLGLEPGTPVDSVHVKRFLDQLTKNLAEEAARYYDLHAVHASPTPGNRTTTGATIDMGTFRYLDAHHGNYTYLFDQLKLSGQTKQLRDYIGWVYSYGRQAGYPGFDQKSQDFFLDIYDKVFEREVTNHWLNRLGLGSGDIGRLSPELRKEFYAVVKEMQEREGKATRKVGSREIIPAAYDVRTILKNTMAVLNLPDDKIPSEMATLFASDRSWSTLQPEDSELLVRRYLKVVNSIKLYSNGRNPRPEWIQRAKRVGQIARMEPGKEFVEKYETPVLEKIREGKASFEELTADSFKGVEAIVDRGLARQWTANFGGKQRVGIYSGTFDPPHSGHVDMVRAMVDAFKLDVIYVFPNPTSDHKNGVSSYADRKKMAEIAFRDVHGVMIGYPGFEEDFARGDIDEVRLKVAEMHPDATLLQLMGDDSFERYQQVVKKAGSNRDYTSNLTVVVSRRGGDGQIERVVGGNPVIFWDPLIEGSSSTEIRAQLRDGKPTPKLAPEVRKYIERKGLFGVDACEGLLNAG